MIAPGVPVLALTAHDHWSQPHRTFTRQPPSEL